jgi:predicted phosphodiesterase
MTRLALISNIHGNGVALDGALTDIETRSVDEIVCLGDIVASGPQPRQVLARLRALDCPVVRGNTDDWVLGEAPPGRGEGTRRLAENVAWARTQLTPADLRYLDNLPSTLSLKVDLVTTFCFHGSPRANTEGLLATTPVERLGFPRRRCQVNSSAIKLRSWIVIPTDQLALGMDHEPRVPFLRAPRNPSFAKRPLWPNRAVGGPGGPAEESARFDPLTPPWFGCGADLTVVAGQVRRPTTRSRPYASEPAKNGWCRSDGGCSFVSGSFLRRRRAYRRALELVAQVGEGRRLWALEGSGCYGAGLPLRIRCASVLQASARASSRSVVYDCAAVLGWSHRGRVRSEAAFARLAGTAPIPASSGTSTRRRLDRGGHRRLNRALHTIVLARRQRNAATIAYMERKISEGKSSREAIRCLKRYLARHLYRLLERTAAET